MPTNKPNKAAIIGTGQMGLVSAMILDSQDSQVALWGHDQTHVTALSQLRESSRHLPGHKISDRVMVTCQGDQAFEDADMIVCAVPTQHIRTVLCDLKPYIAPGVPVVSFAKGIENDSLLRPTQVIREILDGDPNKNTRPVATLCGPTIAEELARCLPATIIAAATHDDFATTLQNAFTTSFLRVYTHSDVLGVELAGATKNVIALAAGMIDGLQAGINAKSALLARGLAEITRLGLAMGAQPDTFFGIAGVGDLATTCFSPLGRNRSCGEALGKGQKLEDILTSTESIVEGVPTTKSVMKLATEYQVEMPITMAVHAILFEGLDPIEAITRLMSRSPKPERVVR